MNQKNKIVWSTIWLLLIHVGLFGQDKYTISGNITDAETGEDLIGATVTVEELPSSGAATNVYGFYSLTLPAGDYALIYSYIGYEDQRISVSLTANQKQNIELGTGAQELLEVVIKAVAEDKNVTSNEMSVAEVSLKEIETIPVLLGEKDVFKTIQLLPGISSAGEGNSGFNVRGGTADQNLILLDEAPVYNASHLLGFFSVFNSDALKDVKVYKGGIPAQFGGRASSVVDIKMKEGNNKEFGGNGSIGLISSKLTLEGPLQKDQGSFMVSGRRTYLDLFFKLSNDESVNTTSLYFYDLNLKANYRLGENDRIFLSGYFGQDNFNFSNDFGFNWGNGTGTLRWNHLFSDRLFSNTSLIFSDYRYSIQINDGEVDISSSIRDWNLKQDYDFYWNDKNTLRFGWNAIHHTFNPGSTTVEEGSTFNDTKIENDYAVEGAAYLANEQKIGDRFLLNYGLRYSNFYQFGPGEVFSYDDDGNVIDTTSYNSGEVVEDYHGLEPRIGATYLLDEKSSVKASYSRTYQYVHLLSNSTTSTPTDIWIPSSNNVKPQLSDQIAVGYFRNFKNNTYEFSAEVYYKWLDNVIDYRNGAELNFNATVEGDLLFGRGRAYGLELFLKKKKGRFTGWLSYTLSKAENQINGINNDAWFNARQDRTHDISVVGMYQISDRLQLSGSWIYYTGNAVTFPSGKYELNDQIINYYSGRNDQRMPDYHRMDVGLTLYNKKYRTQINPTTGEETKIAKRWESNWNFSVYNLYGRENAYSIDFRENEDNPGQTESVRLALFRWVPAVSYNFKF